jgi:PAS domain S-box-containing protein
MDKQIQASSPAEIIRIVAVYSLVGGLWIYLSDTILGMIVQDPVVISRISMYKGLTFIALTATLLYVLIARYIRRIGLHIAERNQVQDALIRQKALLDLVIEGTTDAVYLKDTAGRYLLANSAVSRFVNIPVAELIGHDDTFLFPPDDAKAIMTQDQWVMTQSAPQTYEEHLTTPNGDRYFLATKGATRDDNGIVTGLFGIARDITDRKRIEKDLQIATISINNISDAVYWILPDGHIDRINNAACEMLGYSREELCALSITDVDPIFPAAKWHEHWQMLKQSGSLKLESVHRTRDGHDFPVEISANYIAFENQEFNCATVRDISERKEHEKEQLKIEKLESLGILAGGIAHDFNNILAGIMGNISFAQMFVTTDHKAHKPLVEAEKASVRARELSQQLLTFAKGGDPVKKEFPIQHLVHESVSLVLRGSNVKEIIDIDDSIHAIEADEGQIAQVFRNIILNATQAMPGGGTLTITGRNAALDKNNILALPEGTYVTIAFADEGCGISKNELKKIFDPYYTTKSAGTGLGLASVHSIVARHGGTIDVDSTVGKGTTFTIYLPSTGRTLEHLAEHVRETTGIHQGGAVLVMDDEELIRSLAEDMLTYLGYHVSTCNNGEEAVARYQAAMASGEPFVAVIMDLTIPGGMGGKETATQILAMDPQACLIVSSGYSNDPIMADFSAFGFSGAVSKPYSITEFGHLLGTLLSKRQEKEFPRNREM